MKKKLVEIYDKQYKKLLFIPFIILLISSALIGYNYSVTGDFVNKGVSLKGGSTITINKATDIISLEKDCATFDIIEKHSFSREEFLPRITVACALPKKSKIDFIVEKLTEIGVERIILLKTERTEVVLKDHSKKIARLSKTAESVLKQSGNLFMPKIEFLNFKELLKSKSKEEVDLAVIANLSNDAKSFKEVIGVSTYRNILITIGPEGDFTPEENELAKKAGFICVSLGSAVLKVDTAAIVAAGFVKLFLKL